MSLTGQMYSVFSCQAGEATPEHSILSTYILNEAKEQIASTGMFTTLNNKSLRAAIPDAEIVDCTTLNLVWRPQQELCSIEQQMFTLKQQMSLQHVSSLQSLATLQTRFQLQEEQNKNKLEQKKMELETKT